MSARLRKLTLSLHLAVSIGWMGAVAAYLSLDVTTATSGDAAAVRAAYVTMDLVARSVIVPLALAALVTGIVISAGTEWGLFRHWWVLISLGLTVVATAVLLLETGTIKTLAETATHPGTSAAELRALPSTLAHSIGGLLILLAILVLNVYKPRGVTRYGWRRRREAERSR